ncbi:MAG: hypothetical protein AB199_01440 [Parcubacteria bacterium C7867-004]|nr:MAG: hypothetical protein AB199_01440 [Parcubacteria bacterium C7867-004]
MRQTNVADTLTALNRTLHHTALTQIIWVSKYLVWVKGMSATLTVPLLIIHFLFVVHKPDYDTKIASWPSGTIFEQI